MNINNVLLESLLLAQGVVRYAAVGKDPEDERESSPDGASEDLNYNSLRFANMFF